jgi:regulator of sigma E protease
LRKEFFVTLSQKKRVIVDQVLPAMPAVKAGIEHGDIIDSVNGKQFSSIEDQINFTKDFKGVAVDFVIDRSGQKIPMKITTSSTGQIGALLSELMTYEGDPGLTVYNAEVVSSLVEVKDEKYSWYVSIYKSFGEMVRLSKLTATMFIGVVGGIFSSFSVPDTVSGPVGIAVMTNVLVNDGLVAILRFVALLSLSLAVINILPIPALDGGRLLFIIVEFIIGRRVSQRLESFIHGIGYALILLLILMVTYSDIVKLFS